MWGNALSDAGEPSANVSIAGTVTADELEVRFHHAFDNAPIGMALITPDGNRFKVNQALADFLGYTMEELTNTTMGSTSGNDAELAESLRLRQEVIDGKRRTYTNVRRYQKKSGEIVWGQVTGSLVRDGDGNPAYFVAHTIDVTERRRARDALVASETRFKDFAEIASDWFWEMDADLRYTYVSEAYERVAGRSPAALVGRTSRETYSREMAKDHDAWQAFLTALESREDIQEFRFSYERPDGQRRVFQNSARAIFDADGAFRGYRGTGVDVTREVDVAESLRAAKEVADRANAAKSRFLANMSHEIRTPLSAIIGLSDMTLGNGLTGRSRDYVEKIRQAGGHLLTIVNDVLDFSKFEADTLLLENAEFDLERVLADAVGNNPPGPKLTIGTEIAERLNPRWIGDGARVTQVLSNLVNNAVKFSGEGAIGISVGVTTGEDGAPMLHFRVRDEGIGIAPEDQSAIFDAFTQVDDSSARNFEGTGLGLAISKRLVTAMGGEIWVNSSLGAGSTFEFTVRVQSSSPVTEVRTPRQFQQNTSERPGHLLIVDDNEINLMIAKATVEAAGYTVRLARNGVEAVELACAPDSGFDAVLMDLQMPEMDGYAATREIHAYGPTSSLPIIALTAHAFEEEKQKCAAAGMRGHVSKPLDARLLLGALADVVR